MVGVTFPVTVHEYPSGTKTGKVAHVYELNFPSLVSDPPKTKSALVFIGGLGDGPHTVPYIRTVARRLAEAAAESGSGSGSGTGSGDLSYSVFETRLTSSFSGYGFGSLAADVVEIAALVAYLRGLGKEKVVLLGHSTGCQDCMEYTDYEKYQHSKSFVDGLILQAPVSDREGLGDLMDESEMAESVALAARLNAEGKPDEIMPRDMLPPFMSTPVSAYRWHSLAAFGGDDDYFSSDLPDSRVATIWGRLSAPVLIVPSAEDEHVPPTVDMEKLIARWKTFCRPGIASDLSGLIPGANHRVDAASSQDWLADRVVCFLRSLQA